MSVPHAIKIINLTGAKIPVASGLILQAGATTTFRPTRLQDIEQMIPILDTLVSNGKVNYQFIPSEGGVSGINLVHFGVYGALGTSTVFVRQTFVVNATDPVGWVAPGRVRLRNLRINLGTAPGGIQTTTFYVNVAGTNSALACAVAGTATTSSDLANTVDVLPGQLIKVQVVPSGSSASADLSGSFEMA